MTPNQKRIEKLEQEMKHMKNVSEKTEAMIKQLEVLAVWLNNNLTDEQKSNLLEEMNPVK